MHYRKHLLSALLIFALIRPAIAQPGAGYQKEYVFLHSGNPVADKNFYLLTVIDQTPAIADLLSKDATLRQIHDQRITLLKSHITDTCTWPESMVTGFQFSPSDTQQVCTALQALYRNHRTVFDKMVDRHLRPSGYYQHFVALSNEDLLQHAWSQYMSGTNYIIDQFGMAKNMRSPRIDSPSYDVRSRYYREITKNMFAYLDEKAGEMPAFYHPSLAVAMQLMDLNDRDEPARFEPMESGENKKAVQAIKGTDWSKYAYATIVIPGNGPKLRTTPISPDNKMHCALAAMRYKKRLAPFIIVTGGYCYPFQGPYCEAIEMKKYLMTKLAIPEAAILIDPHARHTTTNIRNADRLMVRYGIPLTKPSVIVTTKSQTDYIALPEQGFDQRNQRVFGYIPYTGKKRLSTHEVEFYPVLESLHMDPHDPLDP